MTQEAKVYEHLLSNGHIDAFTAFSEYRIMRLAAIIFRLKKSGVPIETEMRYKSKDGESVRWAEYKLSRPPVSQTGRRQGDEAEGFTSENITD